MDEDVLQREFPPARATDLLWAVNAATLPVGGPHWVVPSGTARLPRRNAADFATSMRAETRQRLYAAPGYRLLRVQRGQR